MELLGRRGRERPSLNKSSRWNAFIIFRIWTSLSSRLNSMFILFIKKRRLVTGVLLFPEYAKTVKTYCASLSG